MLPNTNEVRFEVSTRCNQRCLICPHWKNTFTRIKQDMPVPQFVAILEKVADELPGITDLTLSGFGESFMNAHVMHMIKHIREVYGTKYKIHVLTNSSKIRLHEIRDLIGVVNSLRFSLHAMTPDAYMNLTGTVLNVHEAVQKVTYAIKKAEHSHLNPKLKEKTEIAITADIPPGYEDQASLLIDAFANMEVRLEIWKPHNWVYGEKYRDIRRAEKKITCGRPFTGPIQIQVDGTINQCCFDFNGDLLLGDTSSLSFAEIYTSDAALKIQEAHKQIDKGDLICQMCDQIREKDPVLLYPISKNRENELSTTLRSIE